MVGEILKPEFYNIIPDCSTDYALPPPAVVRMGCKAIKAVYFAGHATKEKIKEKNEERGRESDVPEDLQAACLKLASIR
jgi:hypothetical protein